MNVLQRYSLWESCASMVVSMYLYPSDGGLIGPIISTQIVENGVLIKGSFPIGAFGTVPFDTFR